MTKWKLIRILILEVLLKTVSELLFVHNYACQTATCRFHITFKIVIFTSSYHNKNLESRKG